MHVYLPLWCSSARPSQSLLLLHCNYILKIEDLWNSSRIDLTFSHTLPSSAHTSLQQSEATSAPVSHCTQLQQLRPLQPAKEIKREELASDQRMNRDLSLFSLLFVLSICMFHSLKRFNGNLDHLLFMQPENRSMQSVPLPCGTILPI